MGLDDSSNLICPLSEHRRRNEQDYKRWEMQADPFKKCIDDPHRTPTISARDHIMHELGTTTTKTLHVFQYTLREDGQGLYLPAAAKQWGIGLLHDSVSTFHISLFKTNYSIWFKLRLDQ